MGIIFGRKNCNYHTDYAVAIQWIDDSTYIKIAEQLREEEAKEIYDKIKAQMQDKSEFIEFVAEKGSANNLKHYFILKKNIVFIKMYRDD